MRKHVTPMEPGTEEERAAKKHSLSGLWGQLVASMWPSLSGQLKVLWSFSLQKRELFLAFSLEILSPQYL